MTRILIVDDETNVRFTLAQALRKQGYEVLEASDGDEALTALTEHRFDLVVSDILMPNREGIETIMEIKMNWPETKVIAMSGGGRAKNIGFLAIARKFGASATMKKPFSVAEFRNTIEKVLNEDSAQATG